MYIYVPRYLYSHICMPTGNARLGNETHESTKLDKQRQCCDMQDGMTKNWCAKYKVELLTNDDASYA